MGNSVAYNQPLTSSIIALRALDFLQLDRRPVQALPPRSRLDDGSWSHRKAQQLGRRTAADGVPSSAQMVDRRRTSRRKTQQRTEDASADGRRAACGGWTASGGKGEGQQGRGKDRKKREDEKKQPEDEKIGEGGGCNLGFFFFGKV